jgi:hypothetical protein
MSSTAGSPTTTTTTRSLVYIESPIWPHWEFRHGGYEGTIQREGSSRRLLARIELKQDVVTERIPSVPDQENHYIVDQYDTSDGEHHFRIYRVFHGIEAEEVAASMERMCDFLIEFYAKLEAEVDEIYTEMLERHRQRLEEEQMEDE